VRSCTRQKSIKSRLTFCKQEFASERESQNAHSNLSFLKASRSFPYMAQCSEQNPPFTLFCAGKFWSRVCFRVALFASGTFSYSFCPILDTNLMRTSLTNKQTPTGHANWAQNDDHRKRNICAKRLVWGVSSCWFLLQLRTLNSGATPRGPFAWPFSHNLVSGSRTSVGSEDDSFQTAYFLSWFQFRVRDFDHAIWSLHMFTLLRSV
jgi:hypothetical protein